MLRLLARKLLRDEVYICNCPLRCPAACMQPWNQPLSPGVGHQSIPSKARRLPCRAGLLSTHRAPIEIYASKQCLLLCSCAGYEAPTQFAEETHNASRNIPWAIVLSVVATSLCGGLHIASLLFSVQVRHAVLAPLLPSRTERSTAVTAWQAASTACSQRRCTSALRCQLQKHCLPVFLCEPGLCVQSVTRHSLVDSGTAAPCMPAPVQDVSAWENGNSGGYLVAQVYHDVFQVY